MTKLDLRLGDCLEVMKTIESGSIDAIITDPPYGTTACKWDSVIDFDLMWEQLNRIIKPNGAIVLFGSEPFSSALRMSNIKNYRYDWVWEKSRPSNIFFKNTQPLKYHENILVFSLAGAHNMSRKKMIYKPIMQERDKKNIRTAKSYNTSGNTIFGNERIFTSSIENDRRSSKNIYPKSIVKIGSMSNFKNKDRHHPTQKPVALMEYLIKTYTNESETVLDFTMGSGSTGVAAKNLNRKFIGIEKDEKYFEIAKQRTND